MEKEPPEGCWVSEAGLIYGSWIIIYRSGDNGLNNILCQLLGFYFIAALQEFTPSRLEIWQIVAVGRCNVLESH